MLAENKNAFKEWAVVINALAQGKQSIILRKGGIQEKNREFRVEHEEFFLFPTYEHQEPADLKSAFHEDLKQVIQNRGEPDQAALRYYVKVEKIFRVSDEKRIPHISPFHIWSDREIEKRFHYGKEKGIYLILVRTFELLYPHIISMTSQYAGCKSWVELDRFLEVREPAAKISDPDFLSVKRQIEAALE